MMLLDMDLFTTQPNRFTLIIVHDKSEIADKLGPELEKCSGVVGRVSTGMD
jgi:hypothetical protein